MPRARAAGPVLRRPATHPLSAHAEAWRGWGRARQLRRPDSCKSAGWLNLPLGSQPTLYLRRTPASRKSTWVCSPFPDRIHPGPDLFERKKVSLPADRQRALQDYKPILEPKIPTGMRNNVDFPCPLDLGGVGAREPCHEGQKALPLRVTRFVVQMHGKAADRPREAGRHVFGRADGLVFKASRDQGGLVMQVPPSLPGKGCEPCFSFQFRRCAKPSMAAIFLVARPHHRMVTVPNGTCQSRQCETQNRSSAHEPRSAERPHLREQCRLRWGSLSGHDVALAGRDLRTVPVSLVRKDIIPQMRQNPAYLATWKIRIVNGKGQEVDQSAIDWSRS